MAKKRATGKRRGLDDFGQPIDLRKDAATSFSDAKYSAMRAAAREDVAEYKRNKRNMQDILRAKTTQQGSMGGRINTRAKAIPMPAVKNNPMTGRTVEAGTRSMLQGLRSWIRGSGGGSIRHGR
jgi:hypothetical protein